MAKFVDHPKKAVERVLALLLPLPSLCKLSYSVEEWLFLSKNILL